MPTFTERMDTVVVNFLTMSKVHSGLGAEVNCDSTRTYLTKILLYNEVIERTIEIRKSFSTRKTRLIVNRT